MSDVHRFTTRYVPSEDRVQLLIELEDTDVQVLWLTRRLLNRLLPPLLKRFDVSSTDKRKAAAAAAVQRFTQAAAVSGIKRQKAVTRTPTTAQSVADTVVTSIDIRIGDRKAVFHLKVGDDTLRSIPMTEQALRQWLNMLYKQYQAAGWIEAFWPNWIDLAGADDAPASWLN